MTGVYCGTGAHDKCAHPRCDCLCHRPPPAVPAGSAATTSEAPTMTTQMFECSACGQMCASAQGLATHRIRVHGRDATSAPSPPATSAAPPGGWVCGDCGRTFASGAALGGHRNAHTRRLTVPGDSPSVELQPPITTATREPLDRDTDPPDDSAGIAGPSESATVALTVHRDVTDLAAALAFLDGTTTNAQYVEALHGWAATTLAGDPDLRSLVQARQTRRARSEGSPAR